MMSTVEMNVQLPATPQTLSASISQLATLALSSGPHLQISLSIGLGRAEPRTPAGQATRPASTAAPRPPQQSAAGRLNRGFAPRVVLGGGATTRHPARPCQHDSGKWSFCSRCHIKRRHVSRWWNRPYRH